MQTGIARGIMSQLQPELTRAEIRLIRRQRPENLTAWMHYHQAVDAIASQGWSEDGLPLGGERDRRLGVRQRDHLGGCGHGRADPECDYQRVKPRHSRITPATIGPM